MSDPVSVLKRELLAAAERQRRQVAVSAGRTRVRARLARGLLLASAIVAVAAASALLITTPWSASRGFLDRAEAALSPPAGAVLHQKWVVTTTSTEFGCTVRHRPNESWVDQTPPHQYRVLLNSPPPPQALNAGRRALACWNGKGTELGGFLHSGETLEFVPPNKLRIAGALFRFPVDPVADLRQSLTAGTAHPEGKTKLNGRTVERIRIDPDTRCASPGCPRQPFYWYVDPNTFHPVGMEGPGGITFHPVGMEGPGGIAPAGKPFLRLHVVVRFLAFEYLPRTPANLELTDIRAQHPNATDP